MFNRQPRKCRPKSFGEVHDNYNWIECLSAKNPNKNYFFNVRSHCRTWTRPVPEDVDLPFFNPHTVPAETSDNENEPSPPVSDLDNASFQDNGENGEIENAIQEEQRFFEIANKIYYHGARNFRYSRRSRRKILEDIPEEDSELCETIPVTDFLEIQYLSEDSAKRLRSPSSSSSESSQESSTESSKKSSSSCHCSCCDVSKDDSDSTTRSYESSTSYQSLSSNFSAPRLKEITLSDLITEPKKKWRRRKKCKIDHSKDEKKLRLTPEKRICDMYGIRTISYDPIFEFINPILPPDVQPSRLTDCSSIASPVPNNPITRFDDLPLHIQDPILSEVSSDSESTNSIEQFHANFKGVNPKIIGGPSAQKKKSYEDILGGKVLCIKLFRIDLDKDYLRWKNKSDDKKEDLKIDQKGEETSEDSETEKSEENSEKYSFTGNSESEESLRDLKRKRRYPRRVRSSRNYKRNRTMYVESDSEIEEKYFGFFDRNFRPLKNRKEKAQKGKRSIKTILEIEYSEIEERDEDRNVEQEKSFSEANFEKKENLEREKGTIDTISTAVTCAEKNFERYLNSEAKENSQREDSEREDEIDEHFKCGSNKNSSYEEENSNVGWVIVNSEVNKMVLKKVLINSGSPVNEKKDDSKTDLKEKRITEKTEREEKSEADIVPNKEMEDLRIDFERTEDKIKSFGAEDLEVRAEIIEDLTLRENIEMRANSLEFLNSSSSTQQELPLTEKIQIWKSCLPLVQTYFQELGEKIEEGNRSQTKSQEIKSQEDEFQNGQQSMDVNEEEELLLFQEDKQKKVREKSKVARELSNKTPENMVADKKIEDLRVDSERKEDKIKSFEVNNSERSTEIVQYSTLIENTETKSNSLEFLNSCKLTARELELNEKIEHLKSGVSSVQTDFEESSDKIEEVNQSKSQEVKSQEYAVQNGEKPMDVDEEELLLLEGDTIDDDRVIGPEEEERLLNGEESIEGNENEILDEEELLLTEKGKDESPEKEKTPTLPGIGNEEDKRSEEKLLGIKNQKDERNVELVITENRNELKVLLIESDNKEVELTLVEKGSKERELTETEKEKDKIVVEKPIDLDEDKSLTETNFSLPSGESKDDEDAMDVEDGGIFLGKEKDESPEEKLIDSGNRKDKSKSPELEKEKDKIVEEIPIDLDEDRSFTESNSLLLECRLGEGKDDENAMDVEDGGILSGKEKNESPEEKLINSGNRKDKSKSPELEREKDKIVEEKPIDLDEDRSLTESNSLLLECRLGEGKDDENAMDVEDGGILSGKEKNESPEEKLINSGNRKDKSKSPELEKEKDKIVEEKPIDLDEDRSFTESNSLLLEFRSGESKDHENAMDVEDGGIFSGKEKDESPEEKLIDSGNRKDKSKSPELEKELNLSDESEVEFLGIENRNDEGNEELIIFENRDEPGFLLIESEDEEGELEIIIGERNKDRDLSGTERGKDKNVVKKSMNVHEGGSSETDTCSTVPGELQVFSDTETIMGDYLLSRASRITDDSDNSDQTQVISDSESD